MRALLVHGMGRTPLSLVRLARALGRSGVEPRLFGYAATFESVDRITQRLRRRITEMATDDYILIGHSLGGVLLRLALSRLPGETRRPSLLVLLASPHRAPRLARRLRRSLPYRIWNGQAGQLLGDEERMSAIPVPEVRCLVVVGTSGPQARWTSFHGEPNDGILAVSEVLLHRGEEVVSLPRTHTFLMNDRRLHQVLAEALGR